VHRSKHLVTDVAVSVEQVTSAVVDVFEAIRTKMNAAVPARYYYKHVTSVHYLQRQRHYYNQLLLLYYDYYYYYYYYYSGPR